ncbi:exopolysaccharide biosynthesis polyprenyl glycosylphosphotransferase [Nocardioides donggukensis]|uniref:Exopolysaccharide biosynthesis polyprenyl glycosylphosphotransferase n=1 Tax=Nocardioides donggukensis TaxID=2774019 RepID=A0A927Q1T7_9ACTN|nr:exopolysaccharide biosynthesis polyprenyl glycosylphosphotransferase [Nocardioides donggukensis]MBD8870497.1 exopolysaccharide biosynthesis polyprenyl glycosylphosphotransferase [Nocardioides donggukensis]
MAAVGLASGVTGVSSEAVLSAAVMLLMATAVVLGVRLSRGARPTRVVVVGDGTSLERVVSGWPEDPAMTVAGGCVVSGLTSVGSLRQVCEAPVAMGLHRLPDLVEDSGADLVLVANGTDPALIREAAWRLERTGVPMAIIGALDFVSPHRVSATQALGTTLLNVSPSRPSAGGRLAKAAIDRVGGVLLLGVALPVLALLFLLVRIDSPGNPVFRQTRIGRDGVPFRMFKLRTMYVDSEARLAELLDRNEVDGNLFKIRHDPRVTRIGSFLRRSSLDELPQLLNVVRGEMSLIGPRPALPEQVTRYDDTIRRRLAVKPGMTGLWQVSGRSDLPYDQAVRLDLHYVDNWRLCDDAVIACRTVGAVISPRGAY